VAFHSESWIYVRLCNYYFENVILTARLDATGYGPVWSQNFRTGLNFYGLVQSGLEKSRTGLDYTKKTVQSDTNNFFVPL
jgi:hypothetical protein